MEPLQRHPGESGQQGVVKGKSHVNAKPSGGLRRHCLAGEEVQVEEDQGNGQTDVDLHGDICPDRSVKQRRTDCAQTWHGSNATAVERKWQERKESTLHFKVEATNVQVLKGQQSKKKVKRGRKKRVEELKKGVGTEGCCYN